MSFKLPRMARKEGVEGYPVDRYRGKDKVARIGLNSGESGGIVEIPTNLRKPS